MATTMNIGGIILSWICKSKARDKANTYSSDVEDIPSQRQDKAVRTARHFEVKKLNEIYYSNRKTKRKGHTLWLE
jgi:hypothetical protein